MPKQMSDKILVNGKETDIVILFVVDSSSIGFLIEKITVSWAQRALGRAR